MEAPDAAPRRPAIKCLGKWCPDSLEKINTSGFIIRAGVIPYIPTTKNKEGRILLPVKASTNLYTDFGGGCKIRKGEKPFDCAHREYSEESLGVMPVNPNNITHILISDDPWRGHPKNRNPRKGPFQVVMMIKMDGDAFDNIETDFANAVVRTGPKGSELSMVKVFTVSEFQKTENYTLERTLSTLRRDIEYVLRR